MSIYFVAVGQFNTNCSVFFFAILLQLLLLLHRVFHFHFSVLLFLPLLNKP